MPVISAGGMRYQFKWQDVDAKEVPRDNQENLEATIHRALALGINHIETARGYGTSKCNWATCCRSCRATRSSCRPRWHPMKDPAKFLETFREVDGLSETRLR